MRRTVIDRSIYINIIIIKFNQVLIKNDIHLDIKLSLTLNHTNKIRNDFLDSIMYRKMVSCIIDGSTDRCGIAIVTNERALLSGSD